MQYAILDIKYADVVLPSFYEIEIIRVQDGSIKDRVLFEINPESEIDVKMIKKYELGDAFLNEIHNAYEMGAFWKVINMMLEGYTVFIFKAIPKIEALKLRADIEHLNMPKFKYVDVYSLARKVWGLLTRESSLENYSKQLSIETEDRGFMIHEMIKKAFTDTNTFTLQGLITKTGAEYGYYYEDKIVNNIKNKEEIERSVHLYETKTNYLVANYILNDN